MYKREWRLVLFLSIFAGCRDLFLLRCCCCCCTRGCWQGVFSNFDWRFSSVWFLCLVAAFTIEITKRGQGGGVGWVTVPTTADIFNYIIIHTQRNKRKRYNTHNRHDRNCLSPRCDLLPFFF